MACIYVLINVSIPNYVKVGYSENVEETLHHLNSSEANPFPFLLFAEYELPVSHDSQNSQKLIERLFRRERTTPLALIRKVHERGFYAMRPEEACDILSNMAKLYGKTVKQFDISSEEEKQNDAQKKMQKGRKLVTNRTSHFRFSMVGLKPGDVIHFRHDPNLTFKVLTDREIEYKGQPTSMSAVMRDLTGAPPGVQGTAHFTYNGEVLSDMRKRMKTLA